jgi:hypothetical protein
MWRGIFSFGVRFNRVTKHGRLVIVKFTHKAQRSIHILSGELNQDFYSDGDMKDALLDAATRNLDIQIAFGPLVHKESIEEFKNLFGGYSNVKLYRLATRPERHYMIFDGDTIRLQHTHPPHSEEPRAIILEKTPSVANTFEYFFHELVKQEGKPA